MKKRTRPILMLTALLIGGGVASALLVDTLDAQGVALPADTPDLSNASLVEVKDGSGLVVLAGQLNEIPEDDDDVERKAELRGSGISAGATGFAEVEVTKTNNQIDQEVELSVSKLAAGATYSVLVDGKQLGTFQTNKDGNAEIELTTPEVKKR
jgi:hypothetical protein